MKVNTHNHNTFSLTNLTDTDLANLARELHTEQCRRADAKERIRKEWTREHYYAFLSHPNATSIQIGETTVVAMYTHSLGIQIGKATPVHGDVFDKNIGIAVAFAKANNEVIPSFV